MAHEKPHIRRVQTISGYWVWGVLSSRRARMPVAVSHNLWKLQHSKIFKKRG